MQRKILFLVLLLSVCSAQTNYGYLSHYQNDINCNTVPISFQAFPIGSCTIISRIPAIISLISVSQYSISFYNNPTCSGQPDNSTTNQIGLCTLEDDGGSYKAVVSNSPYPNQPAYTSTSFRSCSDISFVQSISYNPSFCHNELDGSGSGQYITCNSTTLTFRSFASVGCSGLYIDQVYSFESFFDSCSVQSSYSYCSAFPPSPITSSTTTTSNNQDTTTTTGNGVTTTTTTTTTATTTSTTTSPSVSPSPSPSISPSPSPKPSETTDSPTITSSATVLYPCCLVLLLLFAF